MPIGLGLLMNTTKSFDLAIQKTKKITKCKSFGQVGLSKFEHREKFRKFADLNGYGIKTHFLDISKETRLKRVMKRNAEKGETFEFEVTMENFEFMENWFERPTDKEMVGAIVITD